MLLSSVDAFYSVLCSSAVQVREHAYTLKRRNDVRTLGDMYLLQAVHGSSTRLPEGPGFYKLQGEEMYDIIAAKARESTSTMIPDGSFDEESHWLDVQKDEHKLDFYAHGER